jgi:aldehyde:ferredoxin oxidoreductase
LYTREIIEEVLAVCGVSMTVNDLDALGRSILAEKYRFKCREGFSLAPDSVHIPRRIVEIPSGRGMIQEDEIRRGVARYKELLEKELL